MGAWGLRTFGNDSALGWLHELGEGDPRLVGDTLDGVSGASDEDYVDLDDCAAALAAAELVERVLQGSELLELWDEADSERER